MEPREGKLTGIKMYHDKRDEAIPKSDGGWKELEGYLATLESAKLKHWKLLNGVWHFAKGQKDAPSVL